MNLFEAQHLAGELLREHGLLDWRFRFDHARRRFGICDYRSKTIGLSRPLTLLNEREAVRDTLLHEIAHVLTPGKGHGPAWKAMCGRIGAQPKRCYNDAAVITPPRRPARYQLGCLRCDRWSPRQRKTSTKYRCRTCGGTVVYRAA